MTMICVDNSADEIEQAIWAAIAGWAIGPHCGKSIRGSASVNGTWLPI
jgi:hypothetical protein